MTKRKRSALPEATAELYRKLSQCGTKTGLSAALQALHAAGCLSDDIMNEASTSAHKRHMRESVGSHALAETPYGTVMQSMQLDLPGLPKWEYIHPMAFLHYACVQSIAFGSVMASCCVDGKPLRIIIYIDEVCPGNPLRPEKSRTLQAIYWAIADWPQWLLQRTAAWPTFGTIRSSLVEKYPGKVAGLMNKVLRVFFPPDGHSFHRGVSFQLPNGHQQLCTAMFAGFLCDEKAHNQVADTKGASGIKCCVTCRNVYNRVSERALQPGCVSIRCWNTALLDKYTNDEIYDAYDHIASQPADQQKELEKLLGIKLNPSGMMQDVHIRSIYRPIDHTLRDPMHVFLNNGIANTEIAYLWRVLKARKMKLETLQNYITHWNLPQRHGKIDKEWLGKNRFGKKCTSLQSFSGVLLSIVPVLVCFLQDVCSPGCGLDEHKKCFISLALIIGICSQIGPDDAMAYVDLLASLLKAHGEMFTTLYPSAVKPKFHHALHIPENMAYLGKLLSCFVTERKHRTTKRSALFVFRHIDNTVSKDILSRQIQAFKGDESLFKKEYIVNPSEAKFYGTALERSSAAVLKCGQIRKSDFLYLHSDAVVRAIDFWHVPETDTIAARVEKCMQTAGSHNCWTPSGEHIVIDTADIVDAVTWCASGNGVRIIPPMRVIVQQLSDAGMAGRVRF